MSSGAETLSVLTEKLKKTINEIQDRYESFIDSNQLYKQGKIKERDFFASMWDYLVASSAMNFITVQTIFEIRSLVEMKASVHNEHGQSESRVSAMSPQGITSGSKFAPASQTSTTGQFSMPKPQQPPSAVAETSDQQKVGNGQDSRAVKKCTICRRPIAKQAKFCTQCGNRQ
jgi:hypothetical protein